MLPGFKNNWIAVIDFGSQYTQLIARRIRELNIYSEILPHTITAEQLKEKAPAGIVLSGGPASVFEKNAPKLDKEIFFIGIPLLGICYGMQLTTLLLGGRVRRGKIREYGHKEICVKGISPLFAELTRKLDVWMSHGDQVIKLPEHFVAIASTGDCPVAAMADKERDIYGLQFHPEVVHTPQGKAILKNFVIGVCGCRQTWKMKSFIEETVKSIRTQVGRGDVICGLSGGVDSSVVALLIHKAIGKQLHCIFVDNGLLRYGETKQVDETFRKHFGMDLRIVEAGRLFLKDLKGVTDPELKRKKIGKRFIDLFWKEARRAGKAARFLAQGTLYPDVIESISPRGGPSAVIKSHHNVGGLPPDMKFKLLEPLRELFKDEVREVGRELGLPDEIVERQPFPGPGLAVRIVGEVTKERVALLQQADLRVQEEIANFDGRKNLWQSFAVLLPVKSVGVMGDSRTYENVVAIRAVISQDGMTADWAKLPYDLLGRISNRIINEVHGVNRVVYDISSKPPATIEWE
jgi:GMP synthase (glutamine-hydrolysing)